jgi:hypothetical protein
VVRLFVITVQVDLPVPAVIFWDVFKPFDIAADLSSMSQFDKE